MSRPASSSSSSPRAALARVLSVVVSVLLVLAIGELVLRIAAPPGLRGLHRVEPERPWLYGLKPGARIEADGGLRYAINADGMRDEPLARPKPADDFRILLLGDSLGFGYGVARESAFADRLEQELMAKGSRDRKIDVVNASVNGYSPFNQAELLKERGAGLRPDLVLAQFCVNDLNDPTLHFAASAQLAIGELPLKAFPNPEKRRSVDAWELLCRRSRLCEQVLALRTGGIAGPWDEADAFRSYRALSGEGAAATAPEWAWLEERYGEMALVADGLDSGFAIAVFPVPRPAGSRYKLRHPSPPSSEWRASMSGRRSTCCRHSSVRRRAME